MESKVLIRRKGKEMSTAQENDKLRGILESLLSSPRGTSGRIIIDAEDEAAIRGALVQESAPAQDEQDFNTRDSDLTVLLNIAADLVRANGNMDLGIHYMEVLGRVEQRLASRPARTDQQPVAFIDPSNLYRFIAGKMPAMTVSLYASGSGLTGLYASPVVQVPEGQSSACLSIDQQSPNYKAGWNACRKAMRKELPEDDTRTLAPWRAVVSRKKSPVGTLRGSAVAYLTLECGHTVQVIGEQAIERNHVKRKRCKQCLAVPPSTGG